MAKSILEKAKEALKNSGKMIKKNIGGLEVFVPAYLEVENQLVERYEKEKAKFEKAKAEFDRWTEENIYEYAMEKAKLTDGIKAKKGIKINGDGLEIIVTYKTTTVLDETLAGQAIKIIEEKFNKQIEVNGNQGLFKLLKGVLAERKTLSITPALTEFLKMQFEDEELTTAQRLLLNAQKTKDSDFYIRRNEAKDEKI